MPAPPAGKLPKDYDKLPVPQPQASSVRKRDPKMLAIIDPGKCFGRGCEYCVAVCPVPDCITLTTDPAAPELHVLHGEPRHVHRLHGLREVVPRRLRCHSDGPLRHGVQGARGLRDRHVQRRAARQEDRGLSRPGCLSQRHHGRSSPEPARS